MKRFASLQGKTVRVVIAQTSTLNGDVTIPVGLEGKVVWDEGGDEVVTAFDHDVPDGEFLPGRKNEGWIFRSAPEQLT